MRDAVRRTIPRPAATNELTPRSGYHSTGQNPDAIHVQSAGGPPEHLPPACPCQEDLMYSTVLYSTVLFGTVRYICTVQTVVQYSTHSAHPLFSRRGSRRKRAALYRADT